MATSLLRTVRRAFSGALEAEDVLAELNKSEASVPWLSTQRHLYSTDIGLAAFTDEIIEGKFNRPPALKHNLHKIIRVDGIYPVDEVVKLNGSSFIKTIPPHNDEIMSRFPAYKPPSQDDQLLKTGMSLGAKFVTGSSSITEAMEHIYFHLSNFKSPDITGLGKNYDNKNMNYMSAYRKPITFMLRKLGDSGIYAVDGDEGVMPDEHVILLNMGIILEAMFTTDEKPFMKVMDTSLNLSKEEAEKLLNPSRSYRFRRLGDILVRSQIDCEGIADDGEYFVFEIKTRALAPLRYDYSNYTKYLDYKIEKRAGVDSSFEREYFDIIRSVILKYFFQIKLGRMDGAFVAYHNTLENYGFEYIKLKEMEKRLFGNSEFGGVAMKSCASILEKILKYIVSVFPKDDIFRVGLYAFYKTEELMIVVERFDKYYEWHERIHRNPYIKDEVDYYEMFEQNKVVYSFSLRLFPYLNGIYQKEPLFYEPGDDFNIKMYLRNRGVINFPDYMSFLHSAYKFDSIVSSRDFVGQWKKFNDFHIYRKPMFNSN
jgi:hypothetical protein